MFRRDFLASIAAAAAGLAVPSCGLRPAMSKLPSGFTPSSGVGELIRLLRQCKCVSIEGSVRVDSLIEHRTVHRHVRDPYGPSLNAEFERMLATAKPRSVSYSLESSQIDVRHLGDPDSEWEPVGTIEVEWVGGAVFG
jgi:hypothetical protein